MPWLNLRQFSITQSGAFRALERTIQSTMSDAIVAPYQVVVVTAARHFAPLLRNLAQDG